MDKLSIIFVIISVIVSICVIIFFSFRKKNTKLLKSVNCSSTCSTGYNNPITLYFYATRNGEILDLELEIIWYENALYSAFPAEKRKKIYLDKFHKCESITLPSGNVRCCYTINGVRRTDSYVKNNSNISNDIRYINVDVSKSGDNLYYNNGNENDMKKACG